MAGLKAAEIKLHDALYENINSLTHFYTPRNNFHLIFKKDMFFKNNKAAFIEVSYYLLHVLNKDLTKEKLTSWPPYDAKSETVFRAEVLEYFNSLNQLYDNADIPSLMPSHLISPGGYKIIKLMFKLSQLVIYEHLKRTTNLDVLYRIKPSKNTDITSENLRNIKSITNDIHRQNAKTIEEFESRLDEFKTKSKELVEALQRKGVECRNLKAQYAVEKEKFDKIYPLYPSPEVLQQKLADLKLEMDHFIKVNKLFDECFILKQFLESDDASIEFDSKKICRREFKNMLENGNVLNLVLFYKTVTDLIQQKLIELPNPTTSFLKENIEKVLEKIKELELRENRAEIAIEQLTKQIGSCSQGFTNLNNFAQFMISYSPLLF